MCFRYLPNGKIALGKWGRKNRGVFDAFSLRGNFISNKIIKEERKMKRILSLTLVLLMLISSMFVVSCKKEEDGEERTFTFTVVHADGTSKSIEVTTTKNNLADALVEKGIISGEESQYGLYVTTVDGEYHKWEDDGKYWALYIGEELASTGASSIQIENGGKYTFKVE